MADTTVRTLNPNLFTVAFGTHVVTGFSENSVIKINPNGDMFDSVKGADGGIDRVNKLVYDFTIEISLKQTSPSNDALFGLYLADLGNSSGILPLSFSDGGGASIFLAPQAWISKLPDEEFSASMSDRVWTFKTGQVIPGATGHFIGGNS